MLNSMTGFASLSVNCSNTVYDIEIKSVNSRYLDIAIKVPNNLSNKDYELREIIKSKFSRGKITLIISSKKNGDYSSDVFFYDPNKLKSYLALLKEIKKQVKLKEKLKLEHILLNKDIFSSSTEKLSDEDFEKIKQSILKASDELIKMKLQEGKELEKDLIKRIKKIEHNLKSFQEVTTKSVNEHFENYKIKVNQLLNENASEFFDDRMKLELAILAEKSDISEECVRLRSHLKFFEEIMKKEDQPGRKLNFLCQEMNREANTISAKTLSLEITHKVVEIKEEIERIREQIQNVE